jgi:opacity protein-like surface antigen
MRQELFTQGPGDARALIVAALVLIALPFRQAQADDPLGTYVGGAIGRAQVGTTLGALSSQYASAGRYTKNHSAFKAIIGVRPISLVGAEVSYMDFGSPGGTSSGLPANVEMKGATAFGVLYLPVPTIDIFLKAGIARLQTKFTGTIVRLGFGTCAINSPNCQYQPFRVDRTESSFTAGVGAQYKFGPWALRAEYERFNAAGGNPSLLSAGITWTFR